jgi:hypothetical protein
MAPRDIVKGRELNERMMRFFSLHLSNRHVRVSAWGLFFYLPSVLVISGKFHWKYYSKPSHLFFFSV